MKIRVIICRDNTLIATVCDEIFTNDTIIEKDNEEIIIKNFALVSFFILKGDICSLNSNFT